MRDHYVTSTAGAESGHAASLADRLDPAIGETTSVVGAMLTEFFRRTLRGGVEQIDAELHTVAAERVAAAVAERMPAVERAAAEAGESAGRLVAFKTAQLEVQSLELKTRDAARDLAVRIEQTGHRAESATAAVMQELGGRIEAVDRTARQTTSETAQELTNRIEETEKRVHASTSAEVAQQVGALVRRSRKGTALLKARLKLVEEAAASLAQKHLETDKERRVEQMALRDEIRRLHRVAEEKDEELRKAHHALDERVAVLEKPRGLRAWLARLFGKAKK
jgi:hypothetical protein